jgi:hypothetical protein
MHENPSFSLKNSSRNKVSFYRENHRIDDFLYIFWRAKVCWPLLCLCRAYFVFLRENWIRTQRAGVASSHPSPYIAAHLPDMVCG